MGVFEGPTTSKHLYQENAFREFVVGQQAPHERFDPPGLVKRHHEEASLIATAIWFGSGYPGNPRNT